MKELKIKISGISDPISLQLDQQGLTYVLKEVISFDKCAEAITRLSINNILPAGEVEKSRARLFKQIQQHVNKHNKP